MLDAAYGFLLGLRSAGHTARAVICTHGVVTEISERFEDMKDLGEEGCLRNAAKLNTSRSIYL